MVASPAITACAYSGLLSRYGIDLLMMTLLRFESILVVGLFHSFLNIPINYHPMALLPTLAPTSTLNVADLLSKPLPTTTHHRHTQLIIGDILSALTTSVATTATVDTAPTVVASATPTVVASATTVTSDSVPLLHPNPVPVDAGASLPIQSDFIQAPFRLIRSPTSVAYSTTVSSKATLSNDPYTLITGEDVSVNPVDLSSLDSTDSDSGSCFEQLSDLSDLASHLQSSRRLHSEVFGTANLIFIYSGFNTLIHIWVEPIEVDWFDWIPLPRLIISESYFHIFGLDYLQAFALFHLIPIWIALVFALLIQLFGILWSSSVDPE